MEDCELKMPFIYMCKSQTVNFTTPQFYQTLFFLPRVSPEFEENGENLLVTTGKR